MRPVSLSHLTIRDATPIELIDAAQAGGFDAVGITVFSWTAFPMSCEIVGYPSVVRDIKRMCAATGVRIVDVDHFPITPDVDFDLLARGLDVAAELGATHISSTAMGELDRIIADLDRLAAMAAERQLKVGLEFLRYRGIKTIEEAASVVTKVGRPNLGVLVDSLHLSRSGGTPASISAVGADLISYAQLCDAPAAMPAEDQLAVEARTNRLFPGDGDLWLHDFVAALPADIPLTLETPRREDAHLSPRDRGILAGAALRKFWRG